MNELAVKVLTHVVVALAEGLVMLILQRWWQAIARRTSWSVA